jgi:DNA-binding winged helix-turn-helix (wHTH) protein
MQEAHFESLYPADSRFEEVESVFKYIKAGDSCQIIGLPGVGRNIVLELLAYNRAVREVHAGDNQKWFHFVTVDFSEVRNKPLLEVTKLMFLELMESLHERQKEEEYAKVSLMLKDALVFQDELVLFQGLKKAIDYLATEKELTIIFLFERFEEYIPMLTAGFFSNLRVLRSKAKYRFSVVFSLGRPLEESVDPFMLADFYEFFAGNTVFLSVDNKPITDFRIAHLEKITDKKLQSSLVNKTLALTGGHGKLTRHCLEIVIQKEEMPSVNTFLNHKHVEGALLEIWYYLLPEEQEDVVEIVNKGAKETREPEETRGETQNFLEQIGLAKGGKITIPLFEELVKARAKDLRHEKITFDPQTNAIKRGNINISELLTASEFRLLALLLEHEGEIVSREEVITTVWKNTATTIGVTEQALDQLIFRLRKKIEENPNQPEHIFTIKGHGIKYQS